MVYNVIVGLIIGIGMFWFDFNVFGMGIMFFVDGVVIVGGFIVGEIYNCVIFVWMC